MRMFVVGFRGWSDAVANTAGSRAFPASRQRPGNTVLGGNEHNTIGFCTMQDSQPSQPREPSRSRQLSQPREPSRPRFQFHLSTLLLIMGLCSVLSAAVAGMLRRSLGHSIMAPGFYVIMAAAAPVAVMILFSLALAVVRFFGRRRR